MGLRQARLVRTGRNPERVHGNRVQHRRQASAVIEVGVGRDDQVEAPYPQRGERGHHRTATEVERTGCGSRKTDIGHPPRWVSACTAAM